MVPATARRNGWLRLIRPPGSCELERNGGFCAAANAGIAAARGRYLQLLNNDTEVTKGWVQAGLAPFADETVGSVAPLVLVRSDPVRVDSAGDSYAWMGWPSKRGHGQPAARWTVRPIRGSLRRQRQQRLLPGRGPPPRRGTRSPVRLVLRRHRPGLPVAMGRLSLPLRPAMPYSSRGLGYLRPSRVLRSSAGCPVTPNWSSGRTFPPENWPWRSVPTSPSLPRKQPGGWHEGDCDRSPPASWTPYLPGNRSANAVAGVSRSPRSAIRPPHFALNTGSLEDVRNHLRRPAERSRRDLPRRG